MMSSAHWIHQPQSQVKSRRAGVNNNEQNEQQFGQLLNVISAQSGRRWRRRRRRRRRRHNNKSNMKKWYVRKLSLPARQATITKSSSTLPPPSQLMSLPLAASLRCAAVRMSRCHKCRRWNYAANNENTLYKKWQTIKTVQRTWESGREREIGRQTEEGRNGGGHCVCVKRVKWPACWRSQRSSIDVDCGIAVTNTIVFVSESMSQSVDGDYGQRREVGSECM